MNSNILSLLNHICRAVYFTELDSYREYRDYNVDTINVVTRSDSTQPKMEFVVRNVNNFSLPSKTLGFAYHNAIPIPDNLKSVINHWSVIYGISCIRKIKVATMVDLNIVKSIEISTSDIGYYSIIDLYEIDERFIFDRNYNIQYYIMK